MPNSKPAIPQATVVIFVTRDGVQEVQVHAPSRGVEADGVRLYQKVRPVVDRLDRIARERDNSG